MKTEQGPGYGASILAMVGCGEYSGVREAADHLVEVSAKVIPDEELSERYETQYRKYCRIYPAMKSVFPELR